MFDTNTKIRITWPAFDDAEEESNAGKGKDGESSKDRQGKSNEKSKDGKCKKSKKVKSKKGKGAEGEGDAEDCGCYRAPCFGNCCAGVKACCLECLEALDDCPRCTCYRARCACGRLGRCIGACLRLCGGVFSVIVALVGCLGMLLVLYFLYQAIFKDEPPPVPVPELVTKPEFVSVTEPDFKGEPEGVPSTPDRAVVAAIVKSTKSDGTSTSGVSISSSVDASISISDDASTSISDDASTSISDDASTSISDDASTTSISDDASISISKGVSTSSSVIRRTPQLHC